MARNEPQQPNSASDRNDPDPALRQEAIEREAQSSWAGPSVGVVTPAQTKGGVVGAIIGGAVGLAIGLLIALAPVVDLELSLRLLVIGSIGAVTGSTIGGLLGGFFRPDAEGETGSLPGEGPRSKAERRSGKAE